WIRTDEGDDILVAVSHGMTLGARPCQGSYGERVGQGRCCGTRRLARQVDVYMPVHSRVMVELHTRVYAGATVLGKLVHKQPVDSCPMSEVDSSDDNTAPVQQRRRGIYLLPNIFTTGTLFGGFYAIIAATQGRFDMAAIAIFVAMVMDMLDGRVARLTGTESDFGIQYDSLADLVAFGLASGLVAYLYSLQSLAAYGETFGKIGWLAAFFYAAAAALRLARFNINRGGRTEKKVF